MRHDTFRDQMRTLIAVYPTRDQDQHQIEARQKAYWTALRDLPDDLAARAVNRCIQECRFMPVPAEIIAAADQLDPHWRTRVKAIAAGWLSEEDRG